VLFLTGTLRVWHAVVILLVHGAAGVIGAPAQQLIIHDMVGGSHLASAIRLNASSRYLAILLGPAVGGGLMLLLGPAWGLLANVAIYLPFTIFLTRVRYTGHAHAGGQPRPRTGLADAWRLLGQLRADRRLVTMIVLGGVTSFFVGNAFQAQMPEFAHDFGHDQQDVAYSMLLGANAAGAVVGGLLLEGRGLLKATARNAAICSILWCLAITGFAATSSYPAAIGLLFCAGLLNLAFISMAQTLVQLRAPNQLRGRLIGLFNMSHNGLKAFSGITVGVVGGLIGIHWSLAISAMILLAVTVALFALVIPGRGAEEYS
jgi:hypothetical protein